MKITSSHHPSFQPPGAPQRFGATVPTGFIEKLLTKKESITGLSHTKFVQDTATVWAPKAIVSRSTAEFFEMSFLEFVESALFYYSSAWVGQRFFKGVMTKAAHVWGDDNKQLVTQSLEDLQKQVLKPETLKKVMAAKAGIIVASVLGITMIGEYALNFSKNLLTEKLFKKSQFSDVVNLSNGRVHHNVESVSGKKARKRIKQSLWLAGGVIVAARLLAGGAGRNKALEGINNFIVKNFDFSFKTLKTAAGVTLKDATGADKIAYGLSKRQMRAIIGIGCIGYMDAARDKLELKEVITRLAIVAPYLAYGDEILQNLLLKTFPKADQAGLLGISEDKLRARSVFDSFFKPGEVLPLEKLEGATLRAAKRKLFVIPTLVGLFGTGLSVAMLNRFWTRRRFEKAEAQRLKELVQAEVVQKPLPALPHATFQPKPLNVSATGLPLSAPSFANTNGIASPSFPSFVSSNMTAQGAFQPSALIPQNAYH